MATLNEKLLEDTRYLLSLYNRNLQFRQRFDEAIARYPNTPYRGRPLRIYVYLITSIFREYKDYNQRSKDPEKIKELFSKFHDQKHWYRLTQAAFPEQLLPSKELSEINQIENLPSWQEKQRSYENFLSLKTKVVTTPFSFVKPLAKRLFIRLSPNLISAAVGATIGGSIRGTPGAIWGGLAGGFFPQVVKSGAFQTALRGGGSFLGLGGKGALATSGIFTGGTTTIAAAALTTLPQTASFIKKALTIGVGVILGLVILISMRLLDTNALLMPFDIGQAAPLPTPLPRGGLGYSIPFRDSTVTVQNPEAIKISIRNSWPNAQLQNWDAIISQSVASGWNPAFVLTLWIEETGAQGVSSYTDPLGCDPSHPTKDINISLKCLFDNFSNYTNDKFTDFMCMYSESTNSPCVFNTNPNFPQNIKDWYTKLVPSGPGSLTVSPTSTPAPTIAGDLRLIIKEKYRLSFDPSVNYKYLPWAWQVLNGTEASAPKFLTLLQNRMGELGYSEVILKTSTSTGQRAGNVIFFNNSPGSLYALGDEGAFKQILIHELAHIIHGSRGDPTYRGLIENAVTTDKGFLTGYAQGSTEANTACKNSDSRERTVQLDEDFAESVSYYINKDVKEQNYSNNCPPKYLVNPFATGKYPSHAAFTRDLLGGNNF